MKVRDEKSPNPEPFSGSAKQADQPVRLRYRKGVLVSEIASSDTTQHALNQVTRSSGNSSGSNSYNGERSLEIVNCGKTNKEIQELKAAEVQSLNNSIRKLSGCSTSSNSSGTSSELRESSISSEDGSMKDMAYNGTQNSSHCHHHHHHTKTSSHHSQQLPQYLPHIQSHTTFCQSQNGALRQGPGPRREGSKEFIPAFVLLDAAQSLNERKIRELVRKLSCLGSVEVEPVVNFQDPTGRTALSYACGSGNIIIIEELSKLRRLDPNMPDNEGNAPLHYAAQAGHSEAVDLMLTRFEGIVDPNCRNGTGLTPLMKAGLQGRTCCAKSLICAGASAQLRDYSRGLSAIEWARLCGRHICAEVIIRCSKDNRHPGSPPASNFKSVHPRSLPASQSSFELKRINSDDSPYRNLQNARNVVSGATWLKNKIKKVLGTTGTGPAPAASPTAASVRPETYAMMSNLGGATVCAGSLILPSIKPLLEQQKPKLSRKLTIPTLQVTMDKR